MGKDFPDIHRVINYGPPSTLEQYVQQCGRAGRDEQQALAVLMWHRQQLKHCDDSMKAVVLNQDNCRRHVILEQLGWTVEVLTNPQHLCCMCSAGCCCNADSHVLDIETCSVAVGIDVERQHDVSPDTGMASRTRDVSGDEVSLLKETLIDTRRRMALAINPEEDFDCHTH